MTNMTGNMTHKLYQEPLGLRVVKELTLRCKNCNAPLAEVVLTETNEDRELRGLRASKNKCRVVNCCSCKDGSSFETETIDGSISVAAKLGFALEVEDSDLDDDGILVSTFRVRKENA